MSKGESMIIPEDIQITPTVTDTIPVKERKGNFINDPKENPFDITPTVIDQKVEYDPETGGYIIFEKIGDEYYRTPNTMTFSEYLAWKSKKDEQRYFKKLAGINTGGFKSRLGKLDPIAKLDIKKNLIDRLFGGTDISINPQGSIDLILGGIYNNNDNPYLPQSTQQGVLLDFDMDIRMSVDGKIGDKMKLGFNYDTQATFDFDKKMKLEYDSEQFSEDDIIKKIEAGNVSFPLRSTLIQGVESLFGLKTDLQFGHLKISAIASEQRSKKKNLRVKNGAVEQEYEIRPDEYDESRHFFLSHYHRDRYEYALSNLPQIKGLVDISELEVWVTTNRRDASVIEQQIVGISDLAEGDSSKYEIANPIYHLPSNPDTDVDGNILPGNDANDIYSSIKNDSITRHKDKVITNLTNKYKLESRQFELFVGRKLKRSEFTFHPKLGILSLNQRLRPKEVLAVGYTYKYKGKVYHVGDPIVGGNISNQDSLNSPVPENVRYMKMLKSSSNSTTRSGDNTRRSPMWDLMMKNVYSIGTAQLNQEGFQFDIFYENNHSSKKNQSGSLVRFLPEKGYEFTQLLELFNLDNLNTRLDPQQDGVFDFIPGVTIIPRTGTVIFPQLEPFGKSLIELLKDDLDTTLIEKYVFEELYSKSKTQVEKYLHKNRFIMKGKFKSDFSSEISLGAFNVPEGSVRVSAGGVQLIEGVDYEINYGLGTVKIINTSYLSSGQPINIAFEDNATFSTQQKNMLGIRAEYEINKKMNIGATYLRLFEKPYSEKVNLGDDPINNRVYGLDFNYGDETPFITRMLDKLPFYSTKQPSNINFSAEVAALKPGHSSAIDLEGQDGGLVSVDDFEGATSKISLSSYGINKWVLASTPAGDKQKFREAQLSNNLEYGANRALLNWFGSYNRTGASPSDKYYAYTRDISQKDLFDRQIAQNDVHGLKLYTFAMSYWPSERGPYNFDKPNGGYDNTAGITVTNDGIKLNEPATRWAGVMRSFQNTDFEAINVEYLEFWLLDPYTERNDGVSHDPNETGSLVINLGNISEDLLKDGLPFFENSISTDPNTQNPISKTAWGNVPLTTPITRGFDKANQEKQDLGFDGLSDSLERDFFKSYINEILNENPNYTDINNDPSNDNFVSVDSKVYSSSDNLIKKYKRWNGSERNSEKKRGSNSTLPGNPQADSEDLNENKSLEQGPESYYEYEIPLNRDNSFLDTTNRYITQIQDVDVYNDNDVLDHTEKWYRFRIPLREGLPLGGIEGFRSIQFMRMYMTGFTQPKILRFAELELVRNQWKSSDSYCSGDQGGTESITFSIDQVSTFDNQNKKPFGYVTPKGVKTQRLYNTIGSVNQDEKSLLMEFGNLSDSCEVSIFKLSRMDLRQFKRLQLFVHGESRADTSNIINDGDYSVFVKIGKDFVENYYEYELPLVMSEENDGRSKSDRVWRPENKFDFPLSIFTELKKQRNANPAMDVLVDVENEYGGKARIKGNPSLGYIKGIQIGIRKNRGANKQYGEVWINELRVSGFKEKGGVAATAKLDIQLADLGTLSGITNYSSIGWGAIDQKLDERQKEELVDYSVATNLQLGKLLPKAAKLSIPFYAQYSQEISTPQYDPYDLDLTVDEKIDGATTDDERKEIRDRALDKTTIKTFNFTNVKRQASSSGKPKPWDISNVSVSYAYTKIDHTDPLLKIDETLDERLGLDYSYSRKGKFIKPLKFIKSKALKIFSQFNFNPLPNSFTMSNKLQRYSSRKQYRLPTDIAFAFDDKRFDWNRRYSLKWNLAKSLKLTFNAENLAVIDELRQTGIRPTPEDRDWVDVRGDTINSLGARYAQEDVDPYWKENFRNFGRNKAYNQSMKIDYTLPLKHLPLMDFVKIKAAYQSNFAWDAASINIEHLGNIISNGQTRSINANLDFSKLYKKSKYLKKIERKKKSNKSKKKSKTKTKSKSENDKSGSKKGKKDKKKGDREPSTLERVLVRPLLLLRTVKFTYKDVLRTSIPGLSKDLIPEYFGLNNFDAPGVGFVFGDQPLLSNYLDRNKVWFSKNLEQNQNTIQSRNTSFDAKILIEPIKSMKINVSFKKAYTNNHTELFSFTGSDFEHQNLIDNGSFEATYLTLNTLFGGQPFSIEDNKKRINSVFEDFKNNRVIISERLRSNANGQVTGQHPDNSSYAEGFGDISNQVLIPAFLAAYQGTSPNDIELNIKDNIALWDYIPAPNWTFKYDGLAKLRWFKDIFKTFSISHAYKSSLKVSNFKTNLDWVGGYGDNNKSELNHNYYSQIEIPALRIQESFNPIIGVDIQTSGGMKFNFEYKKKRDLALETTTKRLQEGNTSELVFGFGYILKNVDIPFLTGSKKKSKRSKRKSLLEKRKDKEKEKEGLDAKDKKKKRSKKVTDSRGNELTMNFDFSIRDDVRYVHEFSLAEARADRGTKTISFSPNIEYDIHKNLSLVMYFDYRKQIPYLSSAYTQTNMKGGFKVRFKLN